MARLPRLPERESSVSLVGSTLILVFSLARQQNFAPKRRYSREFTFHAEKSIRMKLSGQSNGVEKWRGDNLFSICGCDIHSGRFTVGCLFIYSDLKWGLIEKGLKSKRGFNWNLCLYGEKLYDIPQYIWSVVIPQQPRVVPEASQEVYLMPRPLLKGPVQKAAII